MKTENKIFSKRFQLGFPVGYYFPDILATKDVWRYGLTPEMVKIIKELPENKVCEECKMALWSCECNNF